MDVAAWDAQARRFFGASLTVDASGARGSAVTPAGQAPAERTVRARSATEEDRALATAAEARMSGGGLGLLAQRCPVVWEIVREAEPDPDALRIAAVLASVLLGPIIDAQGRDGGPRSSASRRRGRSSRPPAASR